MKRIYIVLLLIICLVLPTVTSCGSKEESGESDFICTENSDGTLTVIGWSGLDEHLIVPDEINGKMVTVIAENAFRAVKGLTSVVLPDTVKVIDYAFVYCSSLEQVELGDGIETMNGAFMGCTALTDIALPSSVISCASAFSGCTSLKTALVGEGPEAFDYIFEGCTSLVSANIPDSAKTAISSFEGCTSLEAVEGGAGLISIDNTFKSCSSLKRLTLGASVSELKGAFLNCSSLTEIVGLPTSVSSYEPSFTGCVSLEELIIPKSKNTDEMEKYDIAADVSGCVGLKRLSVLSRFSLKGDFCKTFSGLSAIEEITLPDEMATELLRVDSFYVDALFTGDNAEVYNSSWNSTQTSIVRITDDYGFIDGVSYTHINGFDIDVFDPENIEASTEIIGFKEFTRVSYWCGYPKGENRKNSTAAIERTYTFHLRVTGKSDGTLPSSVFVNGMVCSVDAT